MTQYEAEIALNSAIRANPAPWLGLMRQRQEKLEDDARDFEQKRSLTEMKLRSDETIAQRHDAAHIEATKASAKAYADRLTEKEKQDAVYKMIGEGIEIDTKKSIDEQLIEGMKKKGAGDYSKVRGAVARYKDYDNELKALNKKVSDAEQADHDWVDKTAKQLAVADGAAQFIKNTTLTTKEQELIGNNPTEEKLLKLTTIPEARRFELVADLKSATDAAYTARSVALLNSQIRRPTSDALRDLMKQRTELQNDFNTFRNTDGGKLAMDRMNILRDQEPTAPGGGALYRAPGGGGGGPYRSPLTPAEQTAYDRFYEGAPLDTSVAATAAALRGQGEAGGTGSSTGTGAGAGGGGGGGGGGATGGPRPGSTAARAAAAEAAAAAEPRATGLGPMIARMFTGDNAYQRAAMESENVAAREDVAQAGWYDFLHNFDPVRAFFYKPAGGYADNRPVVHHAALPLPGEVDPAAAAAAAPLAPVNEAAALEAINPRSPLNPYGSPVATPTGPTGAYPYTPFVPSGTQPAPAGAASPGRQLLYPGLRRLPNPLNDRIAQIFGPDAPDLLEAAGKLSAANGISPEQQDATFKAAMAGDAGAQQQIHTVLDYMRQAQRSGGGRSLAPTDQYSFGTP